MVNDNIIIKQTEQKINNFITEHNQYYLSEFNNSINNLSQSTRYNYLLYIVSFFSLCDKNPQDIVSDDCLNYFDHIHKKTKSYQICAYYAIKKYFNYLFLSNINLNNPMENINKPDIKNKKRKVNITNEDIKEIFKAINNGVGNYRSRQRQKNWKERDYMIFLFIILFGLSPSEIINIDMKDINLSNKTLTITNKNNESYNIELQDELIEYIEYWIIKRNILLKDKKEDAFFISINRTRISLTAINSIIKKYSSVILNKNITPNKLKAI